MACLVIQRLIFCIFVIRWVELNLYLGMEDSNRGTRDLKYKAYYVNKLVLMNVAVVYLLRPPLARVGESPFTYL